MMEMGDIASVLGNTFFYIDIVHLVMHNFYILKNQRQKLGEAVAWASVSPLPLHCPIHHGGINTWQFVAPSEGEGGGDVITKLAGEHASLAQNQFLYFGFVFESVGCPHEKGSEMARPQLRLWHKLGLTLTI
jgi:hypothetical protein